MKKWLWPGLAVIALLVLLWLAATWFVGFKTEQVLRQVLAPASNSNGALHTLVDYQRNWFSAQAITRIDVSNTPLGNWTDEVRLRHIIRHGPLVWRSSASTAASSTVRQGLLPALSYWRSQLDLSMADAEYRRWLQKMFTASTPLLADSVIDYDQTINYQARLSRLDSNSDLEAYISLGGLQLSGQLNPRSTSPQLIKLQATALNAGSADTQLTLPELALHWQLDDTAHQLSFTADQVLLQIAETEGPISFTLAGQTDYVSKGKDVQGQLNLQLDDFSAARYPINAVALTADFGGINAIGLQWFKQLQRRLQDKQAQIGWFEEEIEVPESRRAIRQLGIEAQVIADELLQVLFHKMLQREQSQLSYTLDVTSQLGKLRQNAALTYAGTERTMLLHKVIGYDVADWLQLVQGRIQLTMDQNMVPAELRPMLNYPLQKQAVLAVDEQYTMDLSLTGYDAELNGKVYAYEHLAERINPALSALFQRPDTSVPADIMSRIETHGLTDEVLQALERDDTVSAETLELLRQLKAMNDELQ